MTQSSQVWIPASFWHVCFKYSTFGTSQDLQWMQLDPEKGGKSPETKEILRDGFTDRTGLLSLFLMNCCCLILVHIRHFCVSSTVILDEQPTHGQERNKDLQLLSYSNAERGENDRKWVTMRNAELAAETRLRLNIGLPEQRPNPFRDKCRVSEAHLLCGLRFNNWHYNSISHHYLAVWWCCRDGVSEGKEQREWEEDGERT